MRCGTALGVAMLTALAASPAEATVVARGTFSESERVTEQLCGISLVRSTTESGSYRIRLDKKSGGQAFLQRLNLTYKDVYTNPLNGRSMTFEGKSLINELRATHVEGNVYSFTTIEAGQPYTIRDAAGRVVIRDRGVVKRQILFDTLGDSEPGGITLEETVIGVGGPHAGLDQSEEAFCTTVQTLVG
jgi:hypothetical protein